MKMYVIENSYHRLSNLVEECRLIKSWGKVGKEKKRKKKKKPGLVLPISQIPKYLNSIYVCDVVCYTCIMLYVY